MIKAFNLIFFISFLLLLSCKGSLDRCDVKCDNCFSPEICIECYEQCYESR